MPGQSAFPGQCVVLSSMDKGLRILHPDRFSSASSGTKAFTRPPACQTGHRGWDNSAFLFCISAGKTQGSETTRPPKKKKKRPQKKSREREEKAAEPRAQTLGEKSLVASRAGKPAAAKDEKGAVSTGGPTGAELGDIGQGDPCIRSSLWS